MNQNKIVNKSEESLSDLNADPHSAVVFAERKVYTTTSDFVEDASASTDDGMTSESLRNFNQIDEKH